MLTNTDDGFFKNLMLRLSKKRNDRKIMDIYNLINSKAISEYCRKIGHQFNTEELMVLIHRNKNMSIQEKISAYEELIANYPDMEVIERFNCKHHDSVKNMIKQEIERLEVLSEKLKKDEVDAVYSYNYWCDYGNKIIEGKDEFRDIYRTFDEVKKIIDEEIVEDEEKVIISFVITKKKLSEQNYMIRGEYQLDKNRNLKMVNVYEVINDILDIDGICLNIPTPFKKGDLLAANSTTPFSDGSVLTYKKIPVVLEHLITWNKDFKNKLDKGNYDSSDMQGPCYFISENDTLIYDNIFNYDSWEFFDGELTGTQKLLKAVASLMNNKIDLTLFLKAYDEIRANKNRKYLKGYTEEGLRLAGLDEKDIKEIENIEF